MSYQRHIGVVPAISCHIFFRNYSCRCVVLYSTNKAPPKSYIPPEIYSETTYKR